MSMKFEKTDKKDELKLEFTVEAEKFNEGIKKVFNKNAKYFNIPGFRKGKAPIHIVERFYGKEIFYEDAFNEIVPSIFDEEIEKAGLEVVSRPQIDIVQMEKGKDLIFTAIVNTKPEVKLAKYKGIELEKTVYKVTDKDIEEELNKMAERNSRMISIEDRPADKGDTTVIDFLGTVDGVEFEGGKAENYELVLGSNSFISGFEDQVIGMKIDETKDINVTFPEDYFSKELAGKPAVFKVTVHEIKCKELPKIDDDFAKDVSEFDTLKELKDDIKKKLEQKNDDREKAELNEKAIKLVTEKSQVDLPDGMVNLELDNMIEDMERRISYQGINLDQYLQMIGKSKEDFREENRKQAEESLKMKLVLEAICKDANIKANDDEISEKIKELATAYGRKEEELKNNKELVKNISDSIESEKAIKLIIDNAKINEVDSKDSNDNKDNKKEKKATKKDTKKATEQEDVKETKKSSKK